MHVGGVGWMVAAGWNKIIAKPALIKVLVKVLAELAKNTEANTKSNILDL